MSTKTVIYTVATGVKRNINPPDAYNPNFDYVAFTDHDDVPEPYRVIRVDESLADTPRRISRHYKMLPHIHLAEYEVSLYHDSTFRLTQDVAPFIDGVLQHDSIGFYAHYDRDCIYDEQHAIHAGGSASKPVMTNQVRRYQADEYPPHNGLICGGIIVRRHHDPKVVTMMKRWWAEYQAGCQRDQMSANYAFWKVGERYHVIPGDLRECEYMVYDPS